MLITLDFIQKFMKCTLRDCEYWKDNTADLKSVVEVISDNNMVKFSHSVMSEGG